MKFADLNSPELLANRRAYDSVQQVIEYAAARYAEGEQARARIEACKDVGTLDRWIARAITAVSVEDVFDRPV